ncbi:hypothetical protein STA1M1_27920 [Sinisalibacter aestuarii]|uniref:DUF1018 domain-containing protein n=1 Tax=Sinisalibacter aestuarii TaxID=2949426 RepID=A0ABQ5LWB9_9RHOB|nr:hypothetical protein STA1M1_27920 [Sinisalibacter aestuarii]
MQDKTIDNALLRLHRLAMNGKHGGLEHIQVLLQLRGIEPAFQRLSPKGSLGRNGTRRIAYQALQDGPKTTAQVGERVLAINPRLTKRQANHRADLALRRMLGAWHVIREKGAAGRWVWRLAP